MDVRYVTSGMQDLAGPRSGGGLCCADRSTVDGRGGNNNDTKEDRGRSMSSNPYAAPRAAVSDVEVEQEYQEVRFWAAGCRIGRLRYLAYGTGSILLAGAIGGVLAAILPGSLGAIVAVALYIAAVVFSVITAIQRSHDMDWSGWTVLLTLIPFVALIWVFKPGSAGANSHGAPPPPNTTGIKILAFVLPAIAIIGILAAIAIPAYVDYQKRAAGYEQPE
jgi:uncharacterized membrane protein YhaH (DUF805 family)